MKDDKNIFFEFIQTIHTLRSENGCPWDRKQTLHSLKKYLKQECEELIEAIDGDNTNHICEETGDVFFILALMSEISSESGKFTIYDALRGINAKMIRRHPHVFEKGMILNDTELRAQWNLIKSREKKKKTN